MEPKVNIALEAARAGCKELLSFAYRLDQLEIKIDSNFEQIDGISLLPLIMGEPFEEKIAYTETANPLNEKAPPKIPTTKRVRTSNSSN